MKIKHQLWMVAVALTVMISINVQALIFATSTLGDSLRHLSHQSMAAVRLVLSAEASLNRAVSAERTVILVDPNKPYFATLKTYHKDNIDGAVTNMAQLQRLPLGQQSQKQIQKAQSLLESWQQHSYQVFNLREQNTRAARRQALQLTMEDSNYQFAELKDVMTQLITLIEEDAEQVLADAGDTEQGVTIGSALLAGISILAVFIINYWLLRSIMGPLALLRRDLNGIAQGHGDLTHRLPVTGNNELSDLAASFNQFCEHQAQLIGQIKTTLQQVSDSSVDVDESMQALRINAERQKHDSDQVNEEMAVMQGSLQQVHQCTESALTLSAQSRDVVSRADTSLQEATDTIEHMIREVERIAQAITNLSGCTEKIASVTRSINDIAEQTNLLALNAAIEAARAQYHGRGFAVVAGEVRNLSIVTQNLTKDIGTNLAQLVEASAHANEVMENSLRHSHALNEKARSTRALMQQITQSSESQLQANREVTGKVAQQENIVDQTTSRVSHLKALADNASQASAMVSHKMSDMHELAQDLHQLLNQFKTETSDDTYG